MWSTILCGKVQFWGGYVPAQSSAPLHDCLHLSTTGDAHWTMNILHDPAHVEDECICIIGPITITKNWKSDLVILNILQYSALYLCFFNWVFTGSNLWHSHQSVQLLHQLVTPVPHQLIAHQPRPYLWCNNFLSLFDIDRKPSSLDAL